MQSLVSLVLVSAVLVSTPTEKLLAARTRAYEANFRNDAAALRLAIADLDSLVDDAVIGKWALYYAGWAEWMLAASEMQAGRSPDAIRCAERAVAYARRALNAARDDVEMLTLLTNTLVALAVLDRSRLDSLAPEIAPLRRRAIELGPANPRVALMDAGMLFNNPPERGGGQDKGLARWLEAIDLFEREARTAAEDELRPRWGRTLAYGWLAELYLALTPPQLEKARAAVATALELRPDFWYVKEQLLPRLAK